MKASGPDVSPEPPISPNDPCLDHQSHTPIFSPTQFSPEPRSSFANPLLSSKVSPRSHRTPAFSSRSSRTPRSSSHHLNSERTVSDAQRRCQARVRHVKQREEEAKKLQEKRGQELHAERKRRRRLEELKALVLLRESEDKALVKKRGEALMKEKKAIKSMEHEFKSWRRQMTEGLVRLKEQAETFAVKLSEAIGKERRLFNTKLYHLEMFYHPMEIAMMSYHDIDCQSVVEATDHSKALLSVVSIKINSISMEMEDNLSRIREILEEQHFVTNTIENVSCQHQSKISEISENRSMRDQVLSDIQEEINVLEKSLSDVMNYLTNFNCEIENFPEEESFKEMINSTKKSVSSLKYELIDQKSHLKSLEQQFSRLDGQYSRLTGQKKQLEDEYNQFYDEINQHQSNLIDFEEQYGIEVRMAVLDAENNLDITSSEVKLDGIKQEINELKQKEFETSRQIKAKTSKLQELESKKREVQVDFEKKSLSIKQDIRKISAFVERKQQILNSHDDQNDEQSIVVGDVISELVNEISDIDLSLQEEINQSAHFSAVCESLLFEISIIEDSIAQILANPDDLSEVINIWSHQNSQESDLHPFVTSPEDISLLSEKLYSLGQFHEKFDDAQETSLKHRDLAEGLRKKMNLAERRKEVLHQNFEDDSTVISSKKLSLIYDLTDVTLMREVKENLLDEAESEYNRSINGIEAESNSLASQIEEFNDQLETYIVQLRDKELYYNRYYEDEAQKQYDKTVELSSLSEEFSHFVEQELEKFVSDNSEMFSKLRKQYGDGVAVHMIKDYCMEQKQLYLKEVESRMAKFKEIVKVKGELQQLCHSKKIEIGELNQKLNELEKEINEVKQKIENQKTTIDQTEENLGASQSKVEHLERDLSQSTKAFQEGHAMFYEDLCATVSELEHRIRVKRAEYIEAETEHQSTLAEEDVLLTKLQDQISNLLETQNKLIDANAEKEQQLRERWLLLKNELTPAVQEANTIIEDWNYSFKNIANLSCRDHTPELQKIINEHNIADRRRISLYCSWKRTVEQLESATTQLNYQIPSIRCFLEEKWSSFDQKAAQLRVEAHQKRVSLTEQAERLRLEILADAQNFANNPLLGTSLVESQSPKRTQKETVSYSDLLKNLPTVPSELPDLPQIHRELDFTEFQVQAGPLKVPAEVERRGEALLLNKSGSRKPLPDFVSTSPSFMHKS
ncbi:hypothetical protein P9112_004664 [Eukaryota sp. TZLM1-RC]